MQAATSSTAAIRAPAFQCIMQRWYKAGQAPILALCAHVFAVSGRAVLESPVEWHSICICAQHYCGIAELHARPLHLGLPTPASRALSVLACGAVPAPGHARLQPQTLPEHAGSAETSSPRRGGCHRCRRSRLAAAAAAVVDDGRASPAAVQQVPPARGSRRWRCNVGDGPAPGGGAAQLDAAGAHAAPVAARCAFAALCCTALH